TDIVQLLFDERIMSEREVNLLLAISTDCILGVDAPIILARMLKKVLQQLDRKGT
ncbi:CtsR family transcriptional regulator, partial [Streptococcus gordonii]|nr:CtsR family transcriptional regulator [Streptococcus gordonii]